MSTYLKILVLLSASCVFGCDNPSESSGDAGTDTDTDADTDADSDSDSDADGDCADAVTFYEDCGMGSDVVNQMQDEKSCIWYFFRGTVLLLSRIHHIELIHSNESDYGKARTFFYPISKKPAVLAHHRIGFAICR